MKLLRIDHNRCDEFDATSYLWVPDVYAEVDEDGDLTKLSYAVAAAESALLADVALYKEALAADEPPNPGYSFHVKDYSEDLTIREAKVLYEARKATWKEHQAKVVLGIKDFTGYLLDAIPGSIKFWDGFESPWGDSEGLPETLQYSMYWGHRHGTRIDYGETKFKDRKVSDG